MKRIGIICAICFIFFSTVFGQQKSRPNYKVKLGYTVLYPYPEASSHGLNTFDRSPFHGVNIGVERRLFSYLVFNANYHRTFGEQHGNYYLYTQTLQVQKIVTTRFNQFNMDLKIYTSKRMQGGFLGFGAAWLSGNYIQEGIERGFKRKDSNWNLSAGYAQRINSRFLIQCQASSEVFAGRFFDREGIKEFFNWSRQTLSLELAYKF
jgi:hypothetical protein